MYVLVITCYEHMKFVKRSKSGIPAVTFSGRLLQRNHTYILARATVFVSVLLYILFYQYYVQKKNFTCPCEFFEL